MLEKFKPGFLERRAQLRDEQRAIATALDVGVSPQKLIDLGRENPKLDKKSSDRRILWGALAGIALGGAIWAGASRIPKDVTIDEFYSEFIEIHTDWLGGEISDSSLRSVIQFVAEFEIKVAGLYLGFTYLRKKAEEEITNLGQTIKISQDRGTLNEKVEKGENPIKMEQEGWIGIDLGGHGDAIGSTLGEKLGWGINALPFQEGSENYSGYKVWAKLPNPSRGISKEEYFAALDRINFREAAAIVFCPVNHDQAFLPDIKNKDHFDMGFNEIVDRIRLILEYAQMNEMDKKKIIVIADGTLERAVGAYSDSGHSETEKHTLKQTLEDLSTQTGWEIILADPTEIVLDKLTSERYNPESLPLQFYEDPNAAETYGKRFVERVEEFASSHPGRDIRVKNDTVPEKSLHVIYGVDDIATRETTMLNSNDYDHTIAIIIDEARAVGGPYNSLILSNAVSDWIISRHLQLPPQTQPQPGVI